MERVPTQSSSRQIPLSFALPRAPVLDWASFRHAGGSAAGQAPSVEDLPGVTYTTSGRAAIYQALLQLGLSSGERVLVPSYHCPTMVAPVLCAGLQPLYFAIRSDGLPDLAALERQQPMHARAIIVAHYFGMPRSLAEVRAWCDERGVALIEDCAHCFFGQAGARPVGAWGDYATASLSKFFPVSEAGLLGSALRQVGGLALSRPHLRAQLKGGVDVLELAVRHRRLAGLRPLLALAFALKNRWARDAALARPADAPRAEAMMHACDMARIEEAPLWISTALNRWLPRPRILQRRRENFAFYQAAFTDVDGARPLFGAVPDTAAPYVFPLWVDDAERVYHAMRALRLPVFRWDRIWPGTPALPGDAGPLWSRHVLQLLCHQDLSPNDVERTIAATLTLLRGPAPQVPALAAEEMT